MLRGEDSTGVMYCGKDSPQASYLKAALPGYDFVRTKEFTRIEKDSYKYWFMVGHNRAATLGSITNENAHPFSHGAVIGVHNGTIRGGMEELPLSRVKCNVAVDSHAVMMNLAEVGPEDARKEVLSKIDGAYMLVWYDNRDETLNFARNDTRTFHMAQSYTSNTLYYASEAGQLQWLNQRNALGIKDVQFLEAGVHLKFPKGTLEPIAEKFEVYTPPKYVAPVRGNGKWVRDFNKRGTTSSPTIETPLGAINSPDNRVVVGGLKRDVPGKLQEELLELDLAVEDRLSMTPIDSQSEGVLARANDLRYVTGYLDVLGLNCIVHGVEAHVARMAMNRRWTVRPVGVKYAGPDRSCPVLICKMVTSMMGKNILTMVDQTPSSTSSTPATPTKVGSDGVVGPKGELISTVNWMILTNVGCSECGCALLTSDAPTMNWGLADTPYCPTCSAAQNLEDDIIKAEQEMLSTDYSVLLH